LNCPKNAQYTESPLQSSVAKFGALQLYFPKTRDMEIRRRIGVEIISEIRKISKNRRFMQQPL
jgi:hypothetical protein